MSTETVVFSTLAVVGWTAVALGHTHHLFFSAVPCSVLALGAVIEHKRKKRKQNNL